MYKQFSDHIKNCIASEQQRFILWLPVIFGFGIICFFQNYYIGIKIIILTLCILYFIVRYFSLLHIQKYIILIAFIFLLGICAASFREFFIDTKLLEEKTYTTQITGQVISVEYVESGYRVMLKNPKVRDKNTKIKTARISIRGKSIPPNIGSIVTYTGALSPPGKPVTPYGFNFQRYAFFKNIGAVGYGFPKYKVIKESQETGFQIWRQK